MNDPGGRDAEHWCVVRLGDDGRPAVGSVGPEGVLVVAVSTAYGEPFIGSLVADAEAGRGPRELADRAERARQSLRRDVSRLLDDPEVLDCLDDTRAIEINEIKQARGVEAAAAAVGAEAGQPDAEDG